MSSPTVETDPSPTAPPRAGSRAPTHPVAMGLISAVLLWSTFPPAEWWWLAWVALVPLFLLVRSERSRPSIYLGAWVGGFAFWLLAIQWVRFTDDSAWLGWVVMALALSFWWPAFLLLARLAVRRLRLPMMVAAPVVWVGLEYVRAYVLTGFPWYYLAHSHYRVVNLIQIADVTGALGISFLIAMANAWWVDLVTLPLLRPTPAGPRLTRPQVDPPGDPRLAPRRDPGLRDVSGHVVPLPRRPEAGAAPVQPDPGAARPRPRPRRSWRSTDA